MGHWKEVSTENGFEHTSSWWTQPRGAKTTRFEGQGQVMGQEVAVLVDPWSQVDFTNTADSQDCHYQELK